MKNFSITLFFSIIVLTYIKVESQEIDIDDVLDLNKIENIACKYFVICHGTSKPHVEAIAESIEDLVREKAQDKPINKEGRENAEWILIDYFDIVIHVFQEPVRKFYKLEELWADAEIQNIADLD